MKGLLAHRGDAEAVERLAARLQAPDVIVRVREAVDDGALDIRCVALVYVGFGETGALVEAIPYPPETILAKPLPQFKTPLPFLDGIEDAIRSLMHNWKSGDDVYVIGFDQGTNATCCIRAKKLTLA